MVIQVFPARVRNLMVWFSQSSPYIEGMDRSGLEPRAGRRGQGSNEVHRFIALPLENEGMHLLRQLSNPPSETDNLPKS